MPILADIYYHLYEGGGALSPPIVLIHGIGGMYLDWPPDIRRLPGYRVYAIDLPGHGKSRNHGCQAVEGYVEGLLAWLDAVGLYRVVCVGNSLGSAVALHLAHIHPERVAGLGIIACADPDCIPDDIFHDMNNPSTILKGLQALVACYFHADADQKLISTHLDSLQTTRASVVYGDLLACRDFDANAILSEIQAPALVMRGEQDQLSTLRRSQYLANALPKGQLLTVPQAGHMAVLEQPRFVADSLTRFFASIPYNPGQG
jgi:pimeloyl-ACP methyl ester carboxylesterase